jgi:phage replication-related protein YjqB (UPF0714/DUF867 family)
MDKYSSFADIAANEQLGVGYRIQAFAFSPGALIAAPHGGRIEPGTSEIATAIAGEDLSLYLFEGLQSGRHGELHITSDRFDEPIFCELVTTADVVLAVHGRKDRNDAATVWIGGSGEDLRSAVRTRLAHAGFRAEEHLAVMGGVHSDNLCNRGRHGGGVQLELPKSLRERLPASADDLARFATAVRAALIG